MRQIEPGTLILIPESLMGYQTIGVLIEKRITKWSSDHIFITLLTTKGNLVERLVMIHYEKDLIIL